MVNMHRLNTRDDNGNTDHDVGEALYYVNKPITHCQTEEQLDGWEYADGEKAYLDAMTQAADAGENVDWDGVMNVVRDARAALNAHDKGYADAKAHKPFDPTPYEFTRDQIDYSWGYYKANRSLIARDYYELLLRIDDELAEEDRIDQHEVYMMGKPGGL